MSVSREQILEKLKLVQDPELKRDIISLGMLQNIQTADGAVQITLAVTTPSETVKSFIRQEAEKNISSIPGVTSVQVTVSVSRPQASPAQQSVPGIRHVIAVASGKGGVGKTTVSVNLALALAQKGYKIGLMDADIYGPNVPLMLGIDNGVRPTVNKEDKIIPLDAQGIKMISMGVLVPADQPMVWRGPMLHSAVTQLVQKVDWGELDFLLVDLPPGTGDVQLSLVQNVSLTGAVVVTTPQEVALMDVRKGIAMFQKTHVPILGIIENMTGEIFGSGGGKQAAEQYRVPFLGEIPLDARIRVGGDAGKPITKSYSDSPAAQAFLKAADSLIKAVSEFEPSGSFSLGVTPGSR